MNKRDIKLKREMSQTVIERYREWLFMNRFRIEKALEISPYQVYYFYKLTAPLPKAVAEWCHRETMINLADIPHYEENIPGWAPQCHVNKRIYKEVTRNKVTSIRMRYATCSHLPITKAAKTLGVSPWTIWWICDDVKRKRRLSPV
jgi:hypothetical protein